MDMLSGSSDEEGMPHVEIIEQPKARGYRFRYDCEGKTAGCIPGEKTTKDRKSFPSFKLVNTPSGCNLTVVISCVTPDTPHRPHPHKLVGKDCDKGVCTMKIKQSKIVLLQHIGIQCVKKKEVKSSLLQREEVNVNPFNTPSDHGFQYDMKKVRLAIQPFIQDKRTGQHIPVPPVVTNVINDQKGDNELVIMRRDRAGGQAKGGDEIFLLTEKVNKDDIAVQFYDDAGWEAWGDFSPNDVHKQYAIVVQSPRYKHQSIQQSKTVQMRLYRQSDDAYSDPLPYEYKPNDTDPHGVHRKRKRREPLNLPGPSPISLPKLAAFTQKQDIQPETQDLLQRLIEQTLQKNQSQTTATHTITSGALIETQSTGQQMKEEVVTMTTQSQPGPSSHTSPTGIEYPQQQYRAPNTPCLDELIPAAKPTHAIYTTSSTAPIPSFINQMSTNVTAAPIPTMLPGTLGGLPTDSGSIMEIARSLPSSQQVADQGDAQYLFSMITTGSTHEDFSGEELAQFELIDSLQGTLADDAALTEYLGQGRLETDAVGVTDPQPPEENTRQRTGSTGRGKRKPKPK